jgi:hypothetical protein
LEVSASTTSSLPAAVKHQQPEYPQFILRLATIVGQRKKSRAATLHEKTSINFIEGGGGLLMCPHRLEDLERS